MERDIFKIRTSFVAYSVERDFKIRIVLDTPLSPRSSGVGNKNFGGQIRVAGTYIRGCRVFLMRTKVFRRISLAPSPGALTVGADTPMNVIVIG